ncbi:MAG: hypothetical protein ACP5US_12475, partial [Candidatus Kryptoniota bacterium]
AATAAISNPLLEEVSLERVEGILVSITAGTSFGIHEFEEIVKTVRSVAKNGDDDSKIIVGVSIDEKMEKEVGVTVIAAGLNHRTNTPPSAPPPDTRKKILSKSDKDTSWAPKGWRALDEPTFERKGINIYLNELKDATNEDENKAPKQGEKPAFLRKVMD